MIGIIGAMSVEVEKLKSMMEAVTVQRVGIVEFYSGRLCGADAVVAVSGVGKVNAAMCTQSMILKYSPDIIINAGVAGGLSDTLKIGDVAVASYVAEHDMDTSPLGDPYGYITGLDMVNIPCTTWAAGLLKTAAEKAGMSRVEEGIIVSGDQFINSADKKKWLIDNFGAIATEMEGASIGHVCFANGVDFCVLRAISDGADDESDISFSEFTELAADNSIKIITEFIKLYNERRSEFL